MSEEAVLNIAWNGFGALFILIYALKKFDRWTDAEKLEQDLDTPNPPRHFTSWRRFAVYSSLYSLLYLSAYSLIITFPQIIVEICTYDAFQNIYSCGNQTDISSNITLWALLILIGILPTIPKMVQLDEQFRMMLVRSKNTSHSLVA